MNMENEKSKSEKEQTKANPDGLDQWNDRLDENLETEQAGDEIADEKAREYSEKHGSGDQSDAAES
jgi:hypothetical protein